MVISIKVEGLGRVQKAMTGYSRRIPQAGRRGLWNFTQHLAKKLREVAPRGATGHMKSTKGTFAKKLDKNSYAVMMPFYTEALEKGTDHGKWISMRHRKLTMWARMHGINPYALRTHIMNEGTKPHPFTARVIQSEVKRLKKTVEKEINKSIKKTAR